jgi:hypothetical protein
MVIIDPLTGAMWTIEDVNVSLKPLAEIQVDGQTKKVVGYRGKKDPTTGEYKTYPVYEDEKK